MGIIKEVAIEQMAEDNRKRLLEYASYMWARYEECKKAHGKGTAGQIVCNDVYNMMVVDEFLASELIKQMIYTHIERAEFDYAELLAATYKFTCETLDICPADWEWTGDYKPKGV